MKNQILALSLTTAVGVAIGDIKVSAQLAERTQIMMDLAAPYINSELVVEEVVQMAVDKFFKDPSAILKDGVVRNGVLFSEIDDPDGSVVKSVMEGFKEWMDNVGPEGAATVAAITLITGEEMLRHLA